MRPTAVLSHRTYLHRTSLLKIGPAAQTSHLSYVGKPICNALINQSMDLIQNIRYARRLIQN